MVNGICPLLTAIFNTLNNMRSPEIVIDYWFVPAQFYTYSDLYVLNNVQKQCFKRFYTELKK